MINATAAHTIDYDDNFAPGMSDASAVLVPTLLAVALADERESTALIDAYLIGLQAQAWVGEAGIAHALSIAVSLASGVKGQFGTPLKPFHAGMAARNAVEAAALAATGMSGRRDIIEGPQGFCELYAGRAAAQWPERLIIEAWRAGEELMFDNLPHIVTLQIKDGSQLKAQRLSAKGGLMERFSDEDRRQKFADCFQTPLPSMCDWHRLTVS
ncbi:hypothetical protein SG1521 [Sodalis glossinidius str. 'morsitans']|uniref:MmgE/PrpD N-terminal domain-containing protein n=1 Tax=Sodalis glossinidius (strain morsitans) TaxID=343509 RepID=Q2NSS9_SODGM|nr:hypothetical protein SG1521 [Sodalis glossinidius str. 'morsitans']